MKRLAGDWSNLVVVVAGSRYDGLQFAAQHVARAMTRYAPVLYIDPPLSPITRRHAAGSDVERARRQDWRQGFRTRLRLAQDRLAVVTPVAPVFPGRPAVAPLTRALSRQAARAAVRTLDGDVRATLLFSPARRLFGVVGERVRVYYAKDDFSAAEGLIGVAAARSAADEEWAASNADLVVAHSPPLMQRWSRYAPIFVPNGVDAASFGDVDAAALPTDVTLPRPIVGFIGMLTHRIDFSILDAIAASGRSLLLVGPRQNSFDVEEIDALLRRPNVTWIGARRYDELPSYLRIIDVGIVPYVDSAFNRASFPLKALEYLAAGRPVVSTPIPAVDWLNSDFITIAPDAASFAGAVDDAITQRLGNEWAQRRRQFARQHDWHTRVQPLAARLGLIGT